MHIDLPHPVFQPRAHEGRRVLRRPAHHERIGDWSLRVARDPFTGRLICRLGRHNVDYAGGVLTFRFPEHVDTSTALYRVDYGYVRNWSATRVELIRLGARLETDNIANPSGGLTPIPAGELKDATTVLIRPSTKGRYKLFQVSGFTEALAAAEKAGCDPMRSFPR